jgi:hypothetical protein
MSAPDTLVFIQGRFGGMQMSESLARIQRRNTFGKTREMLANKGDPGFYSTK